MTFTPNMRNFLGALVIAFGAGLGWAAALWLVGAITRHIPI
jgi:hypothetical protein